MTFQRRFEEVYAMMLRQPAAAAARPLDLTVHTDDNTSLLYPTHAIVTRSALLQSPSDTLRHHACPPSSSEAPRLRPYSFGPVRSLEGTRANHVTVADRCGIYGEWIEKQWQFRRAVELARPHPRVVNSCWTQSQVPADHGQFIILVVK